jgi:hypothetical protein
MAWVKAIGGRLKTDYRYSVALVYNNFPFPDLNAKQKELITEKVFNILVIREKHSSSTISSMYDPDKMPNDLSLAHTELDLAVEACYRDVPFANDDQRLEALIELYTKFIEVENA